MGRRSKGETIPTPDSDATAEELAVMATVDGSKPAATYLTKEQREVMRLKCADILVNNLDRAAKFLAGDPSVKWGNPHIGLFRTILNKVVPDLPALPNEGLDNDKPLRSLTRQELEAILHRTQIVQEVTAAKLPRPNAYVKPGTISVKQAKSDAMLAASQGHHDFGGRDPFTGGNE